jgi:hypothetical protein
MTERQMAELLKYASPYSILVVTYRNKIMELKVPFRVKLKHKIGDLIKGRIEEVELVKLSSNLKTVFIIREEAYYYYHFNILID